jgi:hypothetical protein
VARCSGWAAFSAALAPHVESEPICASWVVVGHRAKYPGPIGGLEETVDVDETFIGGKASNRKSCKVRPKHPVRSGLGFNQRAELAAMGIVGKRLAYRRPHIEG